MTLRLASAWATATVDPARGGRLTSVRVHGTELLGGAPPVGPGPRSWFDGCFPMAPYVGNVRDGTFTFEGRRHALPRNNGPHAAHGLVDQVEWTVVRAGDRMVELSVPLPGPWPFGSELTQQVTLDDDGLGIRLVCRNRRRRMPAALGLHPWFRRDLGAGPAVLDVSPGRRYRPVGPGIPGDPGPDLGARPWDDVFTDLPAPPVLRWPGGPTLTVTADTGIWMLYEQLDPALCVEPVTSPPNSIGTDRGHVVGPGADLVLSARFAWA